MTKQIIEGFRLSILQLIPGVNVWVSFTPYKEYINSQFNNHKNNTKEGCICVNKHTLILWFKALMANKVYFKISRPQMNISAFEQQLIEIIPVLIKDFITNYSTDFVGFSLKFSSRISFGDFIIAKFLNRDRDHSELWSYLSVLHILQELTFKRYEEKKCTSGFVFTTQPLKFIKEITDSQYSFYKFDHKPKLNYSFFDSPATFRYVDGRNSFYLIDNQQKLHGVLRLKNPDSYSLIDRIGNKHLKIFLEDMPGNNWVSFVGLKDEVYIITGKDQQIRWSKNHWHFRDRSILYELLTNFGFSGELLNIFICTLFAMSEFRYGSVILIPSDENLLPPTVGKIDNSAYGILLRNSIQSSSIIELKSTNSLLGILSSDGLTTISKRGRLMSCGDIIDITEASAQNIQGGGRSQAAITSSFYGISIKISQDGPISLFQNGKKIIQF